MPALTRLGVANQLSQAMEPTDQEAFADFAQRLRHLLPDVEVRAFGSRARGTADRDSDLDVCIVAEAVTAEVRETVYRIAWEVGLEHDCMLIAPILLSRDDFENGPMSASALVANIRRDGVAA